MCQVSSVSNAKCQISSFKCQVSLVSSVSSLSSQSDVSGSDKTYIFVLLVVLLNSFVEFYHCQYIVCTTYLLGKIQVKV